MAGSQSSGPCLTTPRRLPDIGNLYVDAIVNPSTPDLLGSCEYALTPVASVGGRSRRKLIFQTLNKFNKLQTTLCRVSRHPDP